MKKLLPFVVVAASFFPLSSFAFEGTSDKENVCSLERHFSRSIFHCVNMNDGVFYTHSVDPILEFEEIKRLEEEHDVVMTSLEDFSRIQNEVSENPVHPLAVLAEQLPGDNYVEESGYGAGQFRSLPADHPTIKRVKNLARILKEAGVCNLKVKKEDFFNINIQTKTDVLRHFLCLSNRESVFGTRNLGIGGRGPWGINPNHTQAGRICADLPDAALKKNHPQNTNDFYKTKRSRMHNAKCAFRLYKGDGFGDWGEPHDSWQGSNRHCTNSIKNRMAIEKHLNDLASCDNTTQTGPGWERNSRRGFL